MDFAIIISSDQQVSSETREGILDDQQLTEALEHIQERLQLSVDATITKTQGIKAKVEKSQSLIETIKDNIAYVVGLPATLGGAFGFLWDSSGDEAALTHKVTMLEEAVAGLKAENDLLGGGTKNFAIDMSAVPSGSVTVIIVASIIVVGVGLLAIYQRRRKKR